MRGNISNVFQVFTERLEISAVRPSYRSIVAWWGAFFWYHINIFFQWRKYLSIFRRNVVRQPIKTDGFDSGVHITVFWFINFTVLTSVWLVGHEIMYWNLTKVDLLAWCGHCDTLFWMGIVKIFRLPFFAILHLIFAVAFHTRSLENWFFQGSHKDCSSSA